MTETTFTMHIDKELHRQLKMRVAALGITLKDYFLNFVKNDIEDNDLKPEVIEEILESKKHRKENKNFDSANEAINYLHKL